MADGVLRSFSLDAGAAEVGSVLVGDELAIALFDDVALTLTLKTRMPSPLGGDVFLAEASGYEGVKNAVVIRTADGLTVNVQDFRRKKIYKVISTSSDVKIREVEAGGRSCGCDRRVPPVMRNVPAKSASVVAAQGAEPVALRNETADVCVDVLVAYDGNASAWAKANGGGVTNFAQTAVQNMNVALANTGLDKSFRFRLVGIAEVPVSTDDLDVALDSSTDGSGGWAPIKAMRDEVGADIVAVLIDTGSAYGTTGLAWSLESRVAAGFSEYAYSICAIRSVAQSHTMTHEVGHNMGCGHSDIQSEYPGPQLYDYSSGCYFTSGSNDYHTIMAYGTEGPGGDEVPYFSSPDYTYEGVTVGDAKHDNTRTLSNTFMMASQWREVIEEEETGGSEPSDEAPENDAFADALTIEGAEGSLEETNVGATVVKDEPLNARWGSTATVWSNWTAPNDGTVTFDTFGSTFDTVLGVYTGDALGGLEVVAENNDAGGGDYGASAVTFEAVAGCMYRIAVGGYENDAGDIVLNWKLVVPVEFGLEINDDGVLTGFVGDCPADVVIPEGVTRIGNYAFEGCSGLTSVTMPDSVTIVDAWAFGHCANLTEVAFANPDVWLDGSAFCGCEALAGVDLEKVEHALVGWDLTFYKYVGSMAVRVGDVVRIDDITPLIQVIETELDTDGVWAKPAWRINQYKVTFDANGGVGGWSLLMDYGAAIVAPTVAREGYTFAGWTSAVPSTVPVGGITVVAQWEKNVPVLSDDVDDSESPAPTDAASEYNGYLYDAESGIMKGTIQVKVGKPGKDGTASVKATVVAGMKKVSLNAKDNGKVVMSSSGPTEIELVGGEACKVKLGKGGMSGRYGAYLIDGSRNLFASKNKVEAGAAGNAVAAWVGSLAVKWDGGTASVTIDKKGKAKATVVLSNGTKGTAKSQLLIGEEWHCVPVMVAKKMNVSFTLWLPAAGGDVLVVGLGDNAVVGKTGALGRGATFRINADEFAAVFGQTILPYLPNDVSVTQNGTKWTLPKAGKVVYKNGAPDESKLGENPCGLKLTYKAKDGSFKGSFKVYAEVRGKPKATTVTVAGYMINGVGYGTATIKGKGSVEVTIE